MVGVNESKRQKARSLRYKKPIVKNLNFESIQQELLDIQEQCAECEQMRIDLDEEWVPECFDRFFVVAGAGDYYGGILGYDSYESDYMGVSCTDAFAEDESKKVLMRLTKDELIVATRQCFRVFHSFISLQTRYSYLKATMDILRDENTGYLQMVKQIEELYNKLAEDDYYEYGKAYKEFTKFTDNLPKEAWIQ